MLRAVDGFSVDFRNNVSRLQTGFLCRRIFHDPFESHSSILRGTGKIDPENRPVGIDLLFASRKACASSLPGNHVIPASGKDPDGNVPVLTEGRTDIGMNSNHLALHVKEGPSGVSSHNRAVRCNELTATQHSTKSDRR